MRIFKEIPSSSWIHRLELLAQDINSKIQNVLQQEDIFSDLGVGAGGDHTLLIDNEAEKLIINFCKELPIPSTLISEEIGIKEITPVVHRSTALAQEHVWVIADPIDGSRNASRRIPFFNSSIAIADKPQLDQIRAGVVINLQSSNCYLAEQDLGAFHNRSPVSPSNNSDFTKSVIGVNLIKNDFLKQTSSTELYKHVAIFRQLGANAEEICMVGTGGLAAFINVSRQMRTWDMAAAKIFVEEAGGIIRDVQGNPHSHEITPEQHVTLLAVANQSLYDKIIPFFYS